MDKKIPVAIIGPGNIGLDLMKKIIKRSKFMELKLVVGNDTSKHLHIAEEAGIATTNKGIDGLLEHDDIKIVFDATLASAHMVHAPLLKAAGKVAIDLTPAAVGPYVCPPVNLEGYKDLPNLNLITCGGQATIPIVAALSRVCTVEYAEIVACIARDSAGPGTRDSIDEFTITTARALKEVGGAKKSKAIILLNPSKPPIMMSNTIYCLVDDPDPVKINKAVDDMVNTVRQYVPGYSLKVPPTIDGNQVTIMVEIEGAGDYLPKYSGNLDIETSAALAVGEGIAEHMLSKGGAN